IGVITSGITAFYMFRLYFSIFWNKTHDPHPIEIGITTRDSHSEGTMSMKLPLAILALGTLLVGFIPFSNFIAVDGKAFESKMHLTFSIVPVTIAIIGILIAYSLYFRQSDRAQKAANAFGGLYRTAYRKFYIDEVYLFITKRIIFTVVGRPAAW